MKHISLHFECKTITLLSKMNPTLQLMSHCWSDDATHTQQNHLCRALFFFFHFNGQLKHWSWKKILFCSHQYEMSYIKKWRETCLCSSLRPEGFVIHNFIKIFMLEKPSKITPIMFDFLLIKLEKWISNYIPPACSTLIPSIHNICKHCILIWPQLNAPDTQMSQE